MRKLKKNPIGSGVIARIAIYWPGLAASFQELPNQGAHKVKLTRLAGDAEDVLNTLKHGDDGIVDVSEFSLSLS